MTTGAGIALGFIHPHHVDAGYMTSYGQTLQAYPDLSVFDLGSGPRLPTARNQLVQEMLEDGRNHQYFWLVDADMAFPSDTLARQYAIATEHELPILGGLAFCVARSGRIEPTIRVLQPEGGLDTVWDFPRDALVKCDATGGAALLIHREVFERMFEVYKDSPYPWFADSELKDPETGKRYEFGEDVTFCLRARKLGYPIHVHTGIEYGHIKPHVYGLADYERNRAEILEIGEEASRVKHYQEIGLLSKAEEPTVTAPQILKPESAYGPKPMNRAARRRLERARG